MLANLQRDTARGRVDKTWGTGGSAKTVWAAVLAKFAGRRRQRTCRQDCGNRGFCKDCVGSRACKICSTTPAEDVSTRLREQGFLQRLCGQTCWKICSATPPGDVSTRLRDQGFLQRLCGQPCWKISVYGSAVKLLRRKKIINPDFDKQNPQTAALNPAPGTALKCFLLVSCFGADCIQSKMLTFSKNLAWRICRPRKVEPSKNGYGGGGQGYPPRPSAGGVL